MDCFSVAVEACRKVREWIEEKVEKRIEDWENRQEKRCKNAECNWWILCVNKLICWFVWVAVKVVSVIVVTVGKWVTQVICSVVHFIICNIWTLVVFAGLGPIIWVIAKIIDQISGKDWLRGNPPIIDNPGQATVVYCNQTKDTYENLSWFDRLIAIFSTPFKDFGIRGWTNYHMHACAKGSVLQAAKNTDGLYTVDLEVKNGEFFVEDKRIICDSDLGYIRAEIFPRVTYRMSRLPEVGQIVKICGGLFWDADGFLEIHPGVGEVTIL